MSSRSELELEEDLAPRRVDWRLWRRVLGHLKPYPGPVAGMIGGGSVLAGVEVALPLVTARIIDIASSPDGAERRGEFLAWGGVYGGLLVLFAILLSGRCPHDEIAGRDQDQHDTRGDMPYPQGKAVDAELTADGLELGAERPGTGEEPGHSHEAEDDRDGEDQSHRPEW